MTTTYFKPQDGTFSLFITPDDYSAYTIQEEFDSLLNSTFLKPLSLGSLFLRNIDIEEKDTKSEIGFLARREKGSIIVGSLKNFPYFIRGKGFSLIKTNKLRYIFIYDPLSFIYNEQMRNDLSHLLNRLIKSGRGFQIIFLSHRLLPKPQQQFIIDLLKSPLPSLNEIVSNASIHHLNNNNNTLRRIKYYYHEVESKTIHIPTIITMLKSAISSQKNTKIVLFISSKNVQKLLHQSLNTLGLPIIGTPITRSTSAKVVVSTFKNYNNANNGILIASEMFASGKFSFIETDFFLFLHPPIDKEGFKSLGEESGERTSHKIVLIPKNKSKSLKEYYSNIKNFEKLSLKYIQTQPQEKFVQSFKNILNSEEELFKKSSIQFVSIYNERLIRILNDQNADSQMNNEDADKNFSL